MNTIDNSVGLNIRNVVCTSIWTDIGPYLWSHVSTNLREIIRDNIRLDVIRANIKSEING